MSLGWVERWGLRSLRSASLTADNLCCDQVMEDPLQTQRLKFAFESEKGLLGTLVFRHYEYEFNVTWKQFLCSVFHLWFLLSFDAPEQQCGQQTVLPVCQVPGHTGTEVCD